MRMHKKYRLFLLLLALVIVPSTYASDDDPLEPMNRAIFEFNEIVDDNVLKPIAKGYKYVTPDAVDVGISIFFSILGEIGTITNDLLQLKFAQAGRDTMRFFLNSTLGIFGIFDVATPLGLSKNKEDFGKLSYISETFQKCYLADKNTDLYFNNLISDIFCCFTLWRWKIYLINYTKSDLRK